MSAFQHLDSLAAHTDVYKDSQRVAVIDMGSNSFRLIVIEYVPHLSFRVVDEVRETVRLSEGMADTNIMRAAAMDRAARAVQIYAAFCKASGISDIMAVGTSAIRDAKNQQRFLARLQSETGIAVRVLSGYEEAYYGYLAAVNCTTLQDGYVLDMGGGSIQISRVQDRQIGDSISFPYGAVRMSERFLKSDPATPREVDSLSSFLRKEFGALKWYKAKPGMQIVGEGGGLRQVGRLVQKMIGYPLDAMHGYQITLAQMKTVRDELARRNVNDRKKMPGMKPDRADIALGATIVLCEALEAGGFDRITISSQGVREGLFYERFLKHEQAETMPLFADVRQSSVYNLGHLYRYQEKHAEHIAALTLSMFDQLPRAVHQCRPADRDLLWAASMLHDLGVAIDYHDHHKHSAYLILNGGLPGYTHREVALIALLARYHRKGTPSLDEFAALMEPGDERRLIQLSALLRLAEQIDRSRDGVAQTITLNVGGDWAQLELGVRGDGQVALWSVDRHRDIFQQAFGLELEVTMAPNNA